MCMLHGRGVPAGNQYRRLELEVACNRDVELALSYYSAVRNRMELTCSELESISHGVHAPHAGLGIVVLYCITKATGIKDSKILHTTQHDPKSFAISSATIRVPDNLFFDDYA